MAVAQETSFAAFLKTVPIFENSDDAQLELIGSRCVAEHYKAGELILKQGEEVNAYYFLRHGRVAAKVERMTGMETVATLDPPTIFGDLACITRQPCSVDVEAMYDVEVLKIAKGDLNDVGLTNPGILLGMVRLLAGRLQSTIVQGARAAENPVVVLREHPNFEAPAAFSEGLVQSMADQSKQQTMLLKVGAVKTSEMQQFGPNVYRLNWAASGDFRALAGQVGQKLPEWQERFKSVVIHPIGAERMRLVEAFDDLATNFGDLLGPGDSCPPETEDTRAFVVGSANAPQLPELNGRRQLLFDAAETESNHLFGQPMGPRFRRTIDSIARHILRLQVGLALGGGAAWGFMHMGALQVFQDAGLPVDVVAGNSAGTLIGSNWCLGKSCQEIRDQILGMTKSKLSLFEFRFWKMHMIRESTITKHFKGFYGDSHVNHLPIPFWANALNIEDGEELNITNGLLSDCVRASISLPGLFPPVIVQDRLSIDAGLMDSVPINQVRDMGARFAISVNVMQGLKATKVSRKYPGNLVSIIHRAMMSQAHEVGAARCERASDIVIKPDAGKISLLGFDKVDELIECGRRSAEEHMPVIEAAYKRVVERC